MPPTDENEDGEDRILAFIHLYRARRTRKRKKTGGEDRDPWEKNYVYSVYEPESMGPTFRSIVEGEERNFCIPFPMLVPAYNGRKPFFELIDSESISSGVWTQEDFDCPGVYWFMEASSDGVGDI